MVLAPRSRGFSFAPRALRRSSVVGGSAPLHPPDRRSCPPYPRRSRGKAPLTALGAPTDLGARPRRPPRERGPRCSPPAAAPPTPPRGATAGCPARSAAMSLCARGADLAPTHPNHSPVPLPPRGQRTGKREQSGKARLCCPLCPVHFSLVGRGTGGSVGWEGEPISPLRAKAIATAAAGTGRPGRRVETLAPSERLLRARGTARVRTPGRPCPVAGAGAGEPASRGRGGEPQPKPAGAKESARSENRKTRPALQGPQGLSPRSGSWRGCGGSRGRAPSPPQGGKRGAGTAPRQPPRTRGRSRPGARRTARPRRPGRDARRR